MLPASDVSAPSHDSGNPISTIGQILETIEAIKLEAGYPDRSEILTDYLVPRPLLDRLTMLQQELAGAVHPRGATPVTGSHGNGT